MASRRLERIRIMGVLGWLQGKINGGSAAFFDTAAPEIPGSASELLPIVNLHALANPACCGANHLAGIKFAFAHTFGGSLGFPVVHVGGGNFRSNGLFLSIGHHEGAERCNSKRCNCHFCLGICVFACRYLQKETKPAQA